MVGRWRVGADPSVSSKQRMGSTEMHCTAPDSSQPRDGMLTAGPGGRCTSRKEQPLLWAQELLERLGMEMTGCFCMETN